MKYKITVEEIKPNRNPEKTNDRYYDEAVTIYEQSTENKINLKKIIDAFNDAIHDDISIVPSGGNGGSK